jgi:DNA-binding MarR family transcriptional regulator
MKLIDSPEACAAAVLDDVPALMQAIRREVRRHRASDLSVPQLRALIFLHERPGATLSQTAEHVGVTRPAMSKLIDRHVRRALVARATPPDDRRHVSLTLTAAGRATLAGSYDQAKRRMTEILSAVTARDRAAVVRALRTLRAALAPDRDGTAGDRRPGPGASSARPPRAARARRRARPAGAAARWDL